MQVSESASSAITRELVAYSSSRGQADKNAEYETESAWLSARLASIQSLKAQGIMVGLRLAERLLFREPAFGGSPVESVRFVGFVLWRAVFGKKIDSLKAIENSYYLSDTDFRWLQGFSKVIGTGEISSLSLETEGEKSSTLKDAEDPYAGHKDILMYTVGIIEGAIEVLQCGCTVSVHATLSADDETQFVITFAEDC